MHQSTHEPLRLRLESQKILQPAENGENLVPSLIKAASVYATVGEMCNALRDVYGEYAAQSYI